MIRLRIDEVGSGPALVLLHSVGTSGAIWTPHLPRLSRRFRVLVADLPGHGRSPRGAEALSLENMSEAVHHALREHRASPTHVLGLSIGGMIAQVLALTHPDAVASLILCGTTCELGSAQREALEQRARMVEAQGMAGSAGGTLERWFAPGFRCTSPGVVATVERLLLEANPIANAQAWRAIARLDVPHRLGDLRIRALVVNGELDTSIPPGSGERLAALLSAKLVVLPGCAHMAPLEAPDTFLGVVEEFLLRG